jgi:hypothetical protein
MWHIDNDILTHNDTMCNDIMTYSFTKQIYTFNYKQNLYFTG